jgi:hypothetical protein
MKPPKIKIEMSFHWNGTYKVTKLVHASRILLDEKTGRELRVGDTTTDKFLVDALATAFDVTITQTKNREGYAD